MPRKYDPHPCMACGEQTTNRKYCSNACVGKGKRLTGDEQASDLTTERGRSLTYKGPRIQSLDALLEHFEVDLTRWQVDRFKVNKTEMGFVDSDGEPNQIPLFHVNATLKPNAKGIELQQIRAALLDDLREARTHAPVDFRWPQGEHMLELDFMDVHVGKLGWAPEVGEDFDSDIAVQRVHVASEELFQKSSGFKIGETCIPVGNDLSQVDSNESATTAGTRVDTDSRYARIIRRSVRLKRRLIDRALEIAPVRVPIVPGNHDFQTSIAIGQILGAIYEDHPHVTVDDSPNPRKYIEWGECGVMFTHGNNEKIQSLPLIFAAEQKEMWARTTFREVHIGHFHGKKEWFYLPVWEENGVRVRVIPSLCGTDAWHHMKGYVQNIKTAQCFLWDKQTGMSGYFDSNVTRHEAS